MRSQNFVEIGSTGINIKDLTGYQTRIESNGLGLLELHLDLKYYRDEKYHKESFVIASFKDTKTGKHLLSDLKSRRISLREIKKSLKNFRESNHSQIEIKLYNKKDYDGNNHPFYWEKLKNINLSGHDSKNIMIDFSDVTNLSKSGYSYLASRMSNNSKEAVLILHHNKVQLFFVVKKTTNNQNSFNEAISIVDNQIDEINNLMVGLNKPAKDNNPQEELSKIDVKVREFLAEQIKVKAILQI